MDALRTALVGLAVAAAALAGGCDPRVGADPAQRFLLDRLEVDIADVARANRDHESPSFACHAILATIPSFKNAGAVARARINEGRTLCHDGALAFGRAQVQKLEAARRAREDLVEECFDLEHALAILAALDPGDPAAAALSARRKALCP